MKKVKKKIVKIKTVDLRSIYWAACDEHHTATNLACGETTKTRKLLRVIGRVEKILKAAGV